MDWSQYLIPCLTAILSYIGAWQTGKMGLRKLSETNKTDIEKLMRQHEIDIEHLREKHALEMEAKENEHKYKIAEMEKGSELKVKEQGEGVMNNAMGGFVGSIIQEMMTDPTTAKEKIEKLQVLGNSLKETS